MASRIAFTQTTKRFNCPVKREFISLYDMNSMSLMSREELIENIWKSEFDGLFLHHLKQALDDENFALNRLGSNRAALRGLQNGSRLHVAASIIAQRGGCTGSETSLSSDSLGFQYLIQELLIESWAKHNNCWIAPTESFLQERYGDRIGSGSESVVYQDGKDVVKEWKTYKYESIQLALDRITIHNAVFPETSLKVEGFGRTRAGDFAILVRQPFIHINGELVSDKEVIDYMHSIGFGETHGFGGNNPRVHSEYLNSDFYIADLHKENIVRFVDPSGHAFFFVIDCMAYFNTPGLGLGGSFLIHDSEVWAYKSENEWPYAIRSNDKPLHYL